MFIPIDNGYVLYSIISKYMNMRRKPIYVAFVDFQKAFDSVDRDLIYKYVQGCVKTRHGVTNTFSCPTGLRQGCCVSSTS